MPRMTELEKVRAIAEDCGLAAKWAKLAALEAPVAKGQDRVRNNRRLNSASESVVRRCSGCLVL